MNLKTLILLVLALVLSGCAVQVRNRSGNTRLLGLAKANSRQFTHGSNAFTATRVQLAGVSASIDGGAMTVTAGSRISQRFYQQAAPASSSAHNTRGLHLGSGWHFGWLRIETGLPAPDAIISGEDMAGVSGRIGRRAGFDAGFTKERRTTLFAEDTHVEANFDGSSSYGIFYIDPDRPNRENP